MSWTFLSELYNNKRKLEKIVSNNLYMYSLWQGQCKLFFKVRDQRSRSHTENIVLVLCKHDTGKGQTVIAGTVKVRGQCYYGQGYAVSIIVMPPAWKVRRGHLVFGSSVRPSVCPSVCPSVRLSVRNSVPLTFKVQYFKFGWSYSNQTWTESPSMDCSHFNDITCPWGWGRVKIWYLEILSYFDFVAAGGIRVSQTHV